MEKKFVKVNFNRKTALLTIVVMLLTAAAMFVLGACSGGPAEAVDVEINAPEGAPVLLKISDAVKPGKVMSINGEGITAGAVQVAMKLHTKGSSPAVPPEDALNLGIVSTDENGHFVVVTFPEDSVPGVYNVWVKNNAGWSAPIKLNAPRALFMSEREAWKGQTIQVTGRNFDGREFNAARDVKVRLRNVEDGKTYDLTKNITDINPYCIAFTIGDQPLAEYEVEVSNDKGIHWSGLSSKQTLTLVQQGSDPLELGVAWAGTFKWDNRFDVTKYNVTPNSGEDETKDIQSAIDAVRDAGGGVVYIPKGKYQVSSLKLRPNVVLMGESREETNLIYAGTNPEENMFESRDDDSILGTKIGCQGIANIKITLLDNDIRPYHFLWLGQNFMEMKDDDWHDRTAAKIFVVNTIIDTPYDNRGAYVINDEGKAKETTGYGRGMVSISRERIMLKNNHWTGYTTMPSWITVGQYVTEKNNYYEYSNDMSRITAEFSFRENNTFKGHREIDFRTDLGFIPGQQGGMYFNDRQYLAFNSVENIGTMSKNDGEAFTTDTAYASSCDGKVKTGAEASITVVPRGTEGKIAMPKLYGGEYSIIITDGKGMGQIREVVSVDGFTINVDSPWEVIPDKTSKWTMIVLNRDITVYKNTVNEACYGTQLFGGCTDAVVADNTYKNCMGVLTFNKRYSEYGNGGVVVNYYTRVARNSMQGEDYKDHGEGIWITSERNSKGKLYNEVMNFQAEIRENIISGDPKGSGQRSGVGFFTETRLEGKDSSGDITNTIVEGNTFENLEIGIEAINNNYGQMLVNNTFAATVKQAVEAQGLTLNTVAISDTNYALGKTVTASQYEDGFEPEKAVDGFVYNEKAEAGKWYSTGKKDQWLMVDLGEDRTINRWTVKHAGAGNEGLMLNTADFKLQKSNDGKAWKDVDKVEANDSLITDRSVAPFTARYVRLYITNPGQDGAVRIYEFEVHGDSNMPAAGEKAKNEPTPKPLPKPTPELQASIPEDVIYIEAEDAKLDGSASTNTNHNGYSGKAFVDGMQITTSNASVTFKVNVEAAGKYTASMCYATAYDDCYLSLYVNGVDIERMRLPMVSSSWDDWGFVTRVVELKAGENTIMYRRDDDDIAGINLDYLTLTPVRYEAEDTRYSGGIEIQKEHSGFLGTGYAAGIGNEGAKIPFAVAVDSAGDYKINLRYANAGGKDETISLYINGDKIKQISLPVTGDKWYKWTQITEIMTLKQGDNSIEFRHDKDDTGAFNLDSILILGLNQ